MSKPVALITGGGRRRVGYVVAKSLANAGYSIALHYRSSVDSAKLSQAEFQELGVECEIYQADIADGDAVDQMCNQVKDRFGRIDVLLTTSSIWSPQKLEDITPEDVRRNFDVNTLGTFFAAKSAGLIMAGQSDGGVIVTIGDWAIERPYVDHASYFIAKGAIPTLTRTLAVEMASRNPKVRVNCIHPGPVMLPPGTTDSEREDLVAATLTKKVDDPEAVAKAVRFFIDNDFVTGVCLPVDGGRSIYAQESHEVNRKA